MPYSSNIPTVTPIFDPNMELYIIEGQSGIINCSVVSNPPANVTLTFQGANITLSEDNTFTISEATADDAGTYECTANNTLYTASRIVVVEVGSKCIVVAL